MARPAFGNLVVEERPDSVVLRLLTYHKGRPLAVFTYREIATLAQQLAAIKPPDDEDDWSDLV